MDNIRIRPASDAIVDSELWQRAHEALGYEVVDRCVIAGRDCEDRGDAKENLPWLGNLFWELGLARRA